MYVQNKRALALTVGFDDGLSRHAARSPQPVARSQRVSIARRWQDSTVAMLRLVDGQWQWQRTTATDDDNGKSKGKRQRG